MKKDYYQILGINKNATEEEIKKAFRTEAHKHHPDKPSGNEAKFKEANEAYGVLSDKEKRARYDQFGNADFSGFQGGGGNPFGQGGFGGFDFSGFQQGGGSMEFDLGDILGEFFGGGRARRPRRGRDYETTIAITFKESIFGAEKNISINKKNITVTIPSGIENGQSLRLRSQGEEVSGGEPGDLYIRVKVEPHKNIEKSNLDLISKVKIRVTEAILGAEKEIETLEDNIVINIPKGSKDGDMLRVRGKGVPYQKGGDKRGDFIISLSIDIPKKVSRKVEKLLEELKVEGI